MVLLKHLHHILNIKIFEKGDWLEYDLKKLKETYLFLHKR